MPRRGRRGKAKAQAPIKGPAENPHVGTQPGGASPPPGRTLSTQNDRDEAVADFWSRRLRAGEDCKASYNAIAEEVLSYFEARHDRLYTSDWVTTNFMQLIGEFGISVPKVAHLKNSLGPQIYVTNPVRTITPTTSDGVSLALARVMRAYVNAAARESQLAVELRKCVNDAMLRGRGVLWTCWDQTLKVVRSRYVSSMDFFVDPDARSVDEALWIAIRQRVPLWEVKRLAKARGTLARVKDLRREDERYLEPSEEGATNELVPVFTIWSRMGSGVRGRDFKGGSRHNDQFDHVKLEIVQDWRVPLWEGDWEVPFYLDREWPVSTLDLVDSTDRLWPVSPMGQVLSLQQALDLNVSAEHAGTKQRLRTLVFGAQDLPEGVQKKIRSGSVTEYIPIPLATGDSLANKIFVPSLGVAPPEAAQQREKYEQWIETTTGATPAMTGGREPGGVDRTATATRTRSAATTVRVADMRSVIETFASRSGRIEALYVRLQPLSVEEVQPYVPSAEGDLNGINMWLVAVEVMPGVILPIRDTRPKPEREKDEKPPRPGESFLFARDGDLRPEVSLERLYPPCATYFQDPQAAYEHVLGTWQELRQATDPLLIEVAEALGEPVPEEGVPPEMWLPYGLTIQPVTVGDVWRDTAGVTDEELCREYDYTLASGSMAPPDHDKELDLLDQEVGQLLPAALGVGHYDMVNAIIAKRENLLGVSPENRLPPFQPPPPPMPERGEPVAAGGGSEKKGEE